MLNDPKKQLRVAKQLYNKLTPEEALLRLQQEIFVRKTLSFYRYFMISEPRQFRDEMYKHFCELNVFGRVYVGKEGVNAQISVPENNLAALRDYLHTTPGLDNLRLNIAVDDDGKSFSILKIKVRERIVADGITDPSFDPTCVGKYVSAAEFNQLTDDPETVVVDMRNHYEYEVGHFENAREVPSETFREQLEMVIDMFAPEKEKNIIMYCTGGIRCEKASAWMRHKGFDKVYHLEGGIINYVNTVQQTGLENKFVGKNFVFDGRLGEKVGIEVIARCHQCGEPADMHVNCVNQGCHLLFIQCDACTAKYEGCCSEKCQEVIHLTPEEQREIRRGISNGPKIFNKARTKHLCS